MAKRKLLKRDIWLEFIEKDGRTHGQEAVNLTDLKTIISQANAAEVQEIKIRITNSYIL